MCVSPEKVIRLNVSSGYRLSSASFIVSFAFSIGNPCIEPEVSSTKTSSFGVTSAAVTRSGGCKHKSEKAALGPAMRHNRVGDLLARDVVI